MAEQNDNIVVKGYQKRNIKDNLMAATKEEIITTAELVSADFKKSMKKEAIADAIVKTIIGNPEKFLEGLTVPELEFVNELCQLEEGDVLPGPLMEDQFALYRMQILTVYSVDGRDDIVMYDLPHDLRVSIKDIVDKVIKEKEDNQEDAIEAIIMAFLNLYGIIEFNSFVDLVSGSAELTKEQAKDFLYGRYLTASQILQASKDVAFATSPFLNPNYAGDIAEESSKYKDIGFNSTLPTNELLSWGMMPFPLEQLDYAQPVLKLLKKKLKVPGQAEQALTEYWRNCQTDVSPTGPISEFMQYIDFKNSKEAQSLLEKLMDFTNKLPRWIFHGFSPNDVARMKDNSKPQMHISSMKPTYNTDGDLFAFEDEADDFEAMLYHGINPYTGKKIRPNDPCPCGSGKKYKKCHGRLPS